MVVLYQSCSKAFGAGIYRYFDWLEKFKYGDFCDCFLEGGETCSPLGAPVSFSSSDLSGAVVWDELSQVSDHSQEPLEVFFVSGAVYLLNGFNFCGVRSKYFLTQNMANVVNSVELDMALLLVELQILLSGSFKHFLEYEVVLFFVFSPDEYSSSQ